MSKGSEQMGDCDPLGLGKMNMCETDGVVESVRGNGLVA